MRGTRTVHGDQSCRMHLPATARPRERHCGRAPPPRISPPISICRLLPRSNDLEVIRSPSNVRSNSSEKRHVNSVAALTVGLSARQPKERRQVIHHIESTRHGPRSPIAIGVTAILARVKRSRDAYFLGCMWNFRLGSDPTLIGLRAVARSTRCSNRFSSRPTLSVRRSGEVRRLINKMPWYT